MFQSPRPAPQRLTCCATAIPTRGTTAAAGLARRLYDFVEAMADWRCRRHQARHRDGRRRFPF